MTTPTTAIIIDRKRFEEMQRALPSEWGKYMDSPQGSRTYFLAAVGFTIIFSLGTLIALYTANYALSYTAKLIGASNFLRIPPWVKKTILVGGPLLIGAAGGYGAKLSFDGVRQNAQKNIGLGFFYGGWTRPSHKFYTQQFYTPAGDSRERDLFTYPIIKGDLPCHTAIRVKDVSSVKFLLELAKETLTGDQMRTYLNHANEKGETIHSLAQEKGISRELTTILNELELPDLVLDVDL